MGSIRFPHGDSFGSGDIPKGDFKVYTYAEYINSIPLGTEELDDEDDDFLFDYDDELQEKSMKDEIMSKDVKRTKPQQSREFSKDQRRKYKMWHDLRKQYYAQKLSDTKNPKARKNMIRRWKMEVKKKKMQHLENIRNYREKLERQPNQLWNRR